MRSIVCVLALLTPSFNTNSSSVACLLRHVEEGAWKVQQLEHAVSDSLLLEHLQHHRRELTISNLHVAALSLQEHQTRLNVIETGSDQDSESTCIKLTKSCLLFARIKGANLHSRHNEV